MQSTQLTCPNCGSTLNFGVAIAEGAPVECLICMQAFAAENPIVTTEVPAPIAEDQGTPGESSGAAEIEAGESREPVESLPAPSSAQDAASLDPVPVSAEVNDPAPAPFSLPEEAPTIDTAEPITLADPITQTMPAMSAPVEKPRRKRASSDEVLVSKPYSPPAVLSDKADPDVAVPTAPPLHRQRDAAPTNKLVLMAVCLGCLFLLTGGIVIAAWKMATSSRAGSADAKLADKGKPDAEDGWTEDDYQKPVPPPPLSAEEEDELRERIEAEVKQTLKRKASSTTSGDADPGPITTLTVTKQPVAGLNQEMINAAIDKGVAYLKRTQNADGTWHGGHGVGYAAIGGLTLLECDSPMHDPAIQKAAHYVRFNANNLRATYELSLAILFLDRLGEPKDRPLIQGMALRILAGQNDSGGWTYNCPPLSSSDMYHLYSFLQSHKQPNLLNPLGGSGKTQAGITVHPKHKLNDPFTEFNSLVLVNGIERAGSKSDPKKPGLISPVDPDKTKNPPAKPAPKKPAARPIPPGSLPVNLRKLPIVQNQGVKKGQMKSRRVAGDNSNTQFAMLALWTARRHNVPTDQALLASFQRFKTSQNSEGGWGYVPGMGSSPSMTNVGLLGLAMGHGAAPDVIRVNPKNPKEIAVKPALHDATIQKGLRAASRYIGTPSADLKKTTFPMQNLYFLWSVERVAVLYDLKTIGGKDWYAWGAQILVHNQAAAGEWPSAAYPGQSPPLNTCFALLFLRRSNLVQDLTNHLRLTTGIADTEK